MSVKHVGVKDARALQTDEGYTYIDVRSAPEYDQGHPAGAINVPLLHFDPATRQMQPNLDFLAVVKATQASDARLLVGCQMGGRSARAAEMLAAAGYSDVSNVLGGFGGARDQVTGQVLHEGWTQAGLPVESAAPPGGSYDELRAKVKGGQESAP